MSNLPLISVYDRKSELYMPVHGVDTIANAIRSFQQQCLKRDTFFNQYPADFKLVKVGEFDDVTGVIIPCQPIDLAMALDYVEVVKASE